MKLAFYKGKGTIVDKLIRWWTKSKYSHVELVINTDWYSISPRDSEVRCKQIHAKEGNWDFVDLPKTKDVEYVKKFYEQTKGAKYDWLGIFLSQLIPLGIQNRNRWFCSEWCAEALQITNSNSYSPQDLFTTIKG